MIWGDHGPFHSKTSTIINHRRIGPCISLYSETQRGKHPGNRIGWRHRLEDAADQLEDLERSPTEIAKLLGPGYELLDDEGFWEQASDGIAGFMAPNFFKVFRLPLELPNLTVVGNHFHVKPLLPWVLGDGRFYILALGRNEVRLLEGSTHAFHSLHPGCMPTHMDEVGEGSTLHTYPGSASQMMTAVFRGHGVGIDDRKDDLLLYFQKVARALRPILGNERVPLVLASIAYLVPIFQEATDYSFVHSEALLGNPDQLSDEAHARPRFNPDRSILRTAWARSGRAAIISSPVRAGRRMTFPNCFCMPFMANWKASSSHRATTSGALMIRTPPP